jgi:hypothetical protein
MKLSTVTYLIALAGAGLAGGAALAANVAVPADKCAAAWHMASPGGDAIASGADVPVVMNFTMVDSNQDGKIDADEFNKACTSGLVQADEATVKDMQ